MRLHFAQQPRIFRAGFWLAAFFTAAMALTSVCCAPTSRSPEATTSSSTAAQAQKSASKYERMLIRRPGTTPEDEKVYVVMDGQKRWVLHGEWLEAHGYKWPNDVHVIPASEVDPIPIGPPILDMK